jgi:hypothetical protein
MTLKPQALSPDGYIIDQRQTDDLSFGRIPSSKNGCGWIAAYNFLKALGRTPDPEQVLRSLEKTLLFGGRLGLNFFVLALYLRRQGIPVQVTALPFHAQQLSETCRAGIVMYRAGKTNHYAAFRREEDGRLRFFGVVPGIKSHSMSMATFYWDYVKFPITLTITAG